jgi:hypothetical protein
VIPTLFDPVGKATLNYQCLLFTMEKVHKHSNSDYYTHLLEHVIFDNYAAFVDFEIQVF